MSYILESLKKSDKERQSSSTVSTTAMRQAPIFLDDSEQVVAEIKFTLWPLLLIVLLALLGYFFWPYAQVLWNSDKFLVDIHADEILPITEAVNDEPVVNYQTPSAFSEALTDNDILVSYDNVLVEAPQQIVITPLPEERDLYQQLSRLQTDHDVNELYSLPVEKKVINVKATEEKPKPKSIPAIFDLPTSLQDSIPAIQYDAHIYSSDNKSGFVILNGAKRQVGDKLNNGIYIEKVEKSAVILSYQGIVFTLPAMKNWQP